MKLVIAVTLFCLLPAWIIFSPSHKPPGTHFQIQLDAVYRPTGSKLIQAKSRSQSWLLRSRGASRAKGLAYAPRRIEMSCDSAINAYLVDLSDLPPEELAAIQTHPDARHTSRIEVKPLKEYPLLKETSHSKHIDWSLSRWSWKPCMFKLVVECPENPTALVDVRIHYGGYEWDEEH